MPARSARLSRNSGSWLPSCQAVVTAPVLGHKMPNLSFTLPLAVDANKLCDQHLAALLLQGQKASR